jgi:hypothetical protein
VVASFPFQLTDVVWGDGFLLTKAGTSLRRNHMPAQLLVGLEEIRSKWGWYLIFGIVLIVIGVMAIGQAFVASLASMSLLG